MKVKVYLTPQTLDCLNKGLRITIFDNCSVPSHGRFEIELNKLEYTIDVYYDKIGDATGLIIQKK